MNHFLIVSLLFFFSINVHAQEDLSGPSFSDPASIAKVPNGWQNEPFRYEKWAEGSDLAISLDQHLYPVLHDFIQQFARQKGLKIAVKEGTCGISSGMLERKSVDMAGFCCPPGTGNRLPGLKYHTMGMLAVAVLVNADNPLEDISFTEARRIFQGKVNRWSEVRQSGKKAGDNLPIKVIGRLHCKDMPGHWRLLIDREDLFCSPMNEVGEIQMMIKGVAGYGGSIGYEVPWNVVRFDISRRVKLLTLDGVSPYNQQKLLEGKYPVYELLNITTWDLRGRRAALSRELLSYLYGRLNDAGKEYNLVTADRLKKAGWKFKENELVGRPE